MNQQDKPEVRSVVPLESNPQVFTTFAQNLGLQPGWGYLDIYSLEDADLLSFIPRPIKAVILLFPLNESIDSLTNSTTAKIVAEGPDPARPVWFKQTVRNACGLYALLHSLSNNKELLRDDSVLKQLLLNHPVKDNMYFDDDAVEEFLVSINEIYNEKSQEGDTAAPPANENVELHFITFVEKNGILYELDGRSKSGPRALGESSGADLLNDPLLGKRFNWYLDNATESMKLQFSLLGLGPSLD